MTDSERRAAFAKAFAEQGRSDWALYKHLTALATVRKSGGEHDPSFPACHALHYLQMATEKIAKAYRIRDTTADVDDLARHHTGFPEFVNAFFRIQAIRDEYAGKDAALRTLQANASRLASAIEKLAPAVDVTVTPENAEYPWERDGEVYCPCTYGYPTLSILREAGGRATMNIVERAFRDFEKLHIQ